VSKVLDLAAEKAHLVVEFTDVTFCPAVIAQHVHVRSTVKHIHYQRVHLTERSTFSSRSFVAAAQGASRLISPGQHSFHKHSFPYILTLFRSFVSTAIAAFYFRDFGLPFLLKVTENCVRLMPNSHCPTGRDETVLSIRIARCELGIMPHI